MKLKVPGPSSSSDDTEPFLESDPSGRFGRYPDLLGVGSVKKVYRAFDQHEAMDVAWNKIRLKHHVNDPLVAKRLQSEISLLKTLKHNKIIALYGFWHDEEHNSMNFITELCSSGSLRTYRQKHRHDVSLTAVKNWSRQILKGLNYLHTHEPCIIHRDINCNNVFINGNRGEVKIGDLGLAAIVGKSHVAHELLGTPAFMAPELYDEEYDESVDIYSFGMSVLEMATGEIPYGECRNPAQIYKKVTDGVKPKAMDRVCDPELKGFIEKCIGKPRDRPSASDLLKDPFLLEVDCDKIRPMFMNSRATIAVS